MSKHYYLFLDSNKEKVGIEQIYYWEVDEYIQERFLLDPQGKRYEFYSETEAIDWLNANIKRERIDPRYWDRSQVKFKSTDNRNYKNFYKTWGKRT